MKWISVEKRLPPKDGTPFFTYIPGLGQHGPSEPYDVAYWDDDWLAYCKEKCGFQHVTHWLPIEPPE